MSGTGARENADGFKVSVTKLSESRLFASPSRIKTILRRGKFTNAKSAGGARA